MHGSLQSISYAHVMDTLVMTDDECLGMTAETLFSDSMIKLNTTVRTVRIVG